MNQAQINQILTVVNDKLQKGSNLLVAVARHQNFLNNVKRSVQGNFASSMDFQTFTSIQGAEYTVLMDTITTRHDELKS